MTTSGRGKTGEGDTRPYMEKGQGGMGNPITCQDHKLSQDQLLGSVKHEREPACATENPKVNVGTHVE